MEGSFCTMVISLGPQLIAKTDSSAVFQSFSRPLSINSIFHQSQMALRHNGLQNSQSAGVAPAAGILAVCCCAKFLTSSSKTDLLNFISRRGATHRKRSLYKKTSSFA
jgi:hypothetical protein